METEKLFYRDGYMKEFDASVISCKQTEGGYQVVLNRTAFFPEGGGQYADPGWLSEAEVLDVQEKDGVIYHKVSGALEEGTTVHGRLDWDIRFERMQQHTGEHIISGIVHGRFGYENVGFHLGSDYCTMDFNGPITKEELKEIELEANKAVFRNLAVGITYPSREELSSMEYRSKIEIEGQVRIVTVPGYDVCACCAPHLGTTGEIGLIKLVDMVNYKGGERITMLCGFRALADYEIKEENIKAVSALLSAKEYETADAVSHLKEEAGSLKGKIASLQQKLLAYQAAEIPVEEDVVLVFDSGLSQNAPRELM
ncbi:MAG: alanyl-tRNA editing protein, partial [Lachnospiraceae bacterium]|nr:alanyl-tRNA editing protein [Lachnospiraceae bacterium]